MIVKQIFFQAFLAYSEPADGCYPIKPPNTTIPNFTGRWAVLVKRYNCSFEDKVRNAQAAKYDIIIVHNVNSSELGEIYIISDS